MLNDETITAIADELVEAGRTRTPVRRLTARYPDMTVEDSYRVQNLWRHVCRRWRWKRRKSSRVSGGTSQIRASAA